VLARSAPDFFNIRDKWPAVVGLRRLWTHGFLFSFLGASKSIYKRPVRTRMMIITRINPSPPLG
jgi:hypothetical protein